jgi:hypothetical protein
MGIRQYFMLFALLAFLFAVIWLLLPDDHEGAASAGIQRGLPEEISFNFHVKPILSDKCFTCHGPDANKRKAGLRLDDEIGAKGELAENPGKYAIIPGETEKSELISRIFSVDAAVMMPPPDSHLQLSETEKIILKKWIEQGAKYEPHWSFVTPKKAALPEVKDKDWPINEIDYFILSTMEEAGLRPSAPASKEKLIRRLSLDLTGLPPSADELRQFVLEKDEFEYGQIADYYLDKPTYGEHLTRDWLDVARYADSHGYQDDSYRTMWPWRDWVIHAFNENMPYDQFLKWQLAGDLLPNANMEQILATGFNRNHPITQEGGVIDEEYRSTYVSDRTNTLGKGILGLTLECAKCHDHKYDPISQKDYFRMYAFFNYVNEKGLQMDAVQAKNRKYYADAPFLTIDDEKAKSILSFINFSDTVPVKVMVMNDSAYRETHVLSRGEYDAPSDVVEASTPAVVMKFEDTFPKNRLGLARWLTDTNNPLTARVYVNRIWALMFGQGIVRTVEDFGNQGALPSHPELLDWLAVEFMEHGWDIKYLVKTIVSSATYRQSSAITPDKKKADPENIFLSRGPRFRLGAEEIRDYILTTSGLLNRDIGGPSVKPYQPPGLWEETNAGGNRGILTNYIPDTGDKLYRRSLYTFWKRTLPPPSMAIFDAPNRDLCEVRRQKTNTPLQALALQNDEQVLEGARVLAENISNNTSAGKAAVQEMFQCILLRNPTERELGMMLDYFELYYDKFSDDNESAEKLLAIGEYPANPSDTAKTAALMMVAQVLYNLDETITKE